MPYWKCPKCGSKENYQGTEIVTEVKGSGGGQRYGLIGSPIEDSGITPMIGRSEEIKITSNTSEKTVRKCKKCDTLLGEKDKRKTEKEWEAYRSAIKKEQAKKQAETQKRYEEQKKQAEAKIIAAELAAERKRDFKKYGGDKAYRKYFLFLFIPLALMGLIPFFIIQIGYELDFWIHKKKQSYHVLASYFYFAWFIIACIKANSYGNRKASAKIQAAKLQEENETQKVNIPPKLNNNLVKCGNAVAILIGDSKVEISGGSLEEQEACRQWVEENHPEYTILD